MLFGLSDSAGRQPRSEPSRCRSGDTLYELGFVAVGSDGKIIVSPASVDVPTERSIPPP